MGVTTILLLVFFVGLSAAFDTIHVQEENDVTLDCPLAMSHVTWTMMNGLVTLASKLPYTHVTSDHKLTLNHVPQRAAGLYSCHDVTNPGKHAHVIRVIVDPLKAPTFTVTPRNVTAARGHRVTLKCDGNGVPDPTLDWGFLSLMDGFPSDPDTMPGVSISADHRHLVIQSLEPVHQGAYNCRLRNRKGQAVSSAYVSIA